MFLGYFKGFFYCFGCQAGGNVFNFIMKIENITFFEATRMLAQKINLPLPQKEKTKEELLRDKQISLLYKINATAKDFFFACLTKTNYGKSATAYLKKRGLSDEVINEFIFNLFNIKRFTSFLFKTGDRFF